MELREITMRTKKAIRDWAKMPASMIIILDDKLKSLRPNALNELRSKINDEFRGENNMPISTSDWDKKDPKTVRDVRDLVDSHINKKGEA